MKKDFLGYRIISIVAVISIIYILFIVLYLKK